MGESKTLILIDGHALAFRQYYALERTNMKTKDGTPTWAVYGFFKAIFDLLKNENLHPDAIGVAFDVSHHTFRTEQYVEYKANREAMPDPMRVQMGLIYEGLKAFNIPIYTKEGFEADDVIGTISRRACELGHKVYILTGDQDSFQLIRQDGCIKVIIPSKGLLTEYDWNKVYDKLGVFPNQVIDYKALRGDTSDNIPGIKGIGEKTAVKLLSEFQTVDNVLASADKITQKSLKEKIENGVEIAKLSKFLATIVQDVDISFDFESTKIELPDIAKVTEFLRAMQFYSFLKNIEYILKLFAKDIEIPEIETQTIKNDTQKVEISQNTNGQLGLFAQAVQAEVNKTDIEYNSKIITDSQDLCELIDILSGKKVISFKLLADFQNAVNFKIYGIALGFRDDISYDKNKLVALSDSMPAQTFYIPILHNLSKQLDLKFVLAKLKPILENNDIKKLTHDVKIEECMLNFFDIDFSGVVFDTMLASYIKDSNANSDFDIQCMEQINHILPTIVSNTKKSSLADNDVDTMKNYSGDVMASLFELTLYWVKLLEDKEYEILTDIEIPLAYVLAQMESNGVSIDKKYLDELTNEFNTKTSTIASRIFELAGEEFNINSPKQVGNILFDKMQLKSKKKRGKAKNSTSAEVLTALADEYEIAKLILDYRKYAKLKSTYTEALPALVSPIDGRIHTSYNQTVTTTGRLSSSNPNLQNIPIRTEEGNKIRQAFVPSDRANYLIMSADYSQIELRLLAHVSEDEHLIEAFNSGIDVHTLTASKVFEVPIEEVTKEMRYKAKAVNFGIVYGQSKYGLAKALKITPAEAENFINKYFETYPKINEYMSKMVELVEKQGYVETIFGRRRYLDNEINSPNAMIREFAKRAAINHPMQGSASDLIKLAMIDFSKRLKDNNLKSKLIIQVHDELVIETAKDELEQVKSLVLESMELEQPLRVPLLIDVNVGESWKES
ncbi:MAG: DNA polymerase I [Candidatus Melainabacteria bacterium]|nr:MAG: DNA polymerase I [Candidatus Melainabacteria bacterium]